MRKTPWIFLALLSCLCKSAFGAPTDNAADELFRFLAAERYDHRLGLHPELISKWLGPQLADEAKVIECDAARARAEEPTPTDVVDAGLFFDRWDPPSRCVVTAPTGSGVVRVATVNCEWGKGRDHPAGSRIQLFAQLQAYDGAWKVVNVIHGHQEPTGATQTDLVTRMKAATHQSLHPDICATRIMTP